MKDLAAKDLGVYFPPPIGVACGMGTNRALTRRLKKMSEFYKGPVVWDSQQISNAVNDDARYVLPCLICQDF